MPCVLAELIAKVSPWAVQRELSKRGIKGHGRLYLGHVRSITRFPKQKVVQDPSPSQRNLRPS